jgi:hypothetical protein
LGDVQRSDEAFDVCFGDHGGSLGGLRDSHVTFSKRMPALRGDPFICGPEQGRVDLHDTAT